MQWQQNQHFYEFFAGPETWSAAKTTAVNLGGYLATTTSEAEDEVCMNLANGAGFWLGGSDQGHVGIWLWETGPV